MYPSTNTRSDPTDPIETIAIVPTTLNITPYLTIYDLEDTIKYIHTYIKEFNHIIHTDKRYTNDQIASMITTIIDTSINTHKQYEKIIELSSKLSTYEDRLEKMSNKET